MCGYTPHPSSGDRVSVSILSLLFVTVKFVLVSLSCRPRSPRPSSVYTRFWTHQLNPSEGPSPPVFDLSPSFLVPNLSRRVPSSLLLEVPTSPSRPSPDVGPKELSLLPTFTPPITHLRSSDTPGPQGPPRRVPSGSQPGWQDPGPNVDLRFRFSNLTLNPSKLLVEVPTTRSRDK